MKNNEWIATRIKEVSGNEKSREYYIGTGEEYGRVGLGNDYHKEFISAPFHPFPAKVGEGELVPDLDAKTTYENIDPKSEVFKYTIILFERIRNLLKNVENPKNLFSTIDEMDDAYYGYLKNAMLEARRVAEVEYFNNNDTNSNYWTNEKRLEDISAAHRAICVIEWPDFLKKSEEIRKIEEDFEKNYGEDWYLRLSLSKEFDDYEEKIKNLYNEAVKYYNKNNGELDIQ